MLYRELREIVIGETDPESLFDIWFQDYSKMLSEKNDTCMGTGVS